MARPTFHLPDWTAATPPPAESPADPPSGAIARMTRVAPGRWVWTEPGFEGIAEAIDRARALDPHPTSAARRLQSRRRTR